MKPAASVVSETFVASDSAPATCNGEEEQDRTG